MTQYNQSSYSSDCREKLTTWSILEWIGALLPQAKGDHHPGTELAWRGMDQEGYGASLPKIREGVHSVPVMLLAFLSRSLVVGDMNLGSILHGVFLS